MPNGTTTALKLSLSARQTADFELIANGGFAPLTGFQGSEDWESVIEGMRLQDGAIWPIPIVLATDLDASEGDVVELTGPDGKPLGRLTVEEVWERDLDREAELVYRTTEDAHPGVAAIRAEGSRCLAGPIEADALPEHDEVFQGHLLSPAEAKATFAKREWKTIVAFQTRNPIHRAHEYLTKAALETSDGLFIHPVIGETKSDDIPADLRLRCYEELLEHYYPAGRVVLSVNPLAMRYAGPREAVLHAVQRRNYGCTHFIVGRDHAGVGSYYGTFDAHHIFDDLPVEELGIQPLFFDHAFWCKECKAMVSNKTCPHDEGSHLFLSGTKVRDMLAAGESLPEEFTRPEIAQILVQAYRQNGSG
jgi:sulfate adenylyltransferase